MMKTVRKQIIVMGIVVLILVAGAVAVFAASSYSTPAGAIAGLTGRDVQSVIDERAETGKTFGTIAKEAGVLDAFRAEMMEIRRDILAARVAAGKMTQEQADAIMAKVASRQATCDDSGAGCKLHGAGCVIGAGFGMDSSRCQETGGQNNGHGNGHHNGGRGNVSGCGRGLGNGGHGHGAGINR